MTAIIKRAPWSSSASPITGFTLMLSENIRALGDITIPAPFPVDCTGFRRASPPPPARPIASGVVECRAAHRHASSARVCYPAFCRVSVIGGRGGCEVMSLVDTHVGAPELGYRDASRFARLRERLFHFPRLHLRRRLGWRWRRPAFAAGASGMRISTISRVAVCALIADYTSQFRSGLRRQFLDCSPLTGWFSMPAPSAEPEVQFQPPRFSMPRALDSMLLRPTLAPKFIAARGRRWQASLGLTGAMFTIARCSPMIGED